ncbi:MAG: hypothetical protein MJ176_10185 [Treponema sp.]|nr:hypothetical protein [Treponema sp.]
MKKTKLIAAFLTLFTLSSSLQAQVFFSGAAGGRLNSGLYKNSEDKSAADLTANVFFQSQTGITDNIWIHADFSMETTDIANSTLFNKTPAFFQFDELSITYKARLDKLTNYLGAYMGAFDVAGSDIFLRRQFGLKNISSKLTDDWLGNSGKLLYPHFGAGLSETVQFPGNQAAAVYLYVNKETADFTDFMVLNGDLRYACAFEYITADFSLGFGGPLKETYKANDVFVVINTLYLHTGLTMLIGNSYTQSVFLQTGLSNAEYSKKTKKIAVTNKNLYFLLEPRFKTDFMNIHLSLFSLTPKACDNMFFIDDTFGFAVNIFDDRTESRNNGLKWGVNTIFSFENCSLVDIKTPDYIKNAQKNLTVNPYAGLRVFGGELNAGLRMNLSYLIQKEHQFYEGLKFNVGYRAEF